MKAIRMTTKGDPSVLQLVDLDKPSTLEKDQVLVKIEAAGVNPVDTKLRRNGTYYPESMPCILGCDGAGVVMGVGSEVTTLVPGDRVHYCYGGIGGHPGNYAEYNVIPHYVAAKMPENYDFRQAAASPLVLITAWEALFDQGKLKSGDTVLIHAGAGGVGHVAIQLAKAQGATVITTVSTNEKESYVNSLGADMTILYTKEKFPQAVLDWTNGQGVDLALDTVGGNTFEQTFACVSYMGKVVTLLQPSQTTDWKAARIRNLQIGLELMLTPMFLGIKPALEHQGTILEKCASFTETGKLNVHVDRVYPLAEASHAHMAIEDGHGTGKIVLEIAS